jgi:hypothetical protein
MFHVITDIKKPSVLFVVDHDTFDVLVPDRQTETVHRPKSVASASRDACSVPTHLTAFKLYSAESSRCPDSQFAQPNEIIWRH